MILAQWYIRKEVKEVGVYNKKDRRTEGQRLILAFSSGELINKTTTKRKHTVAVEKTRKQYNTKDKYFIKEVLSNKMSQNDQIVLPNNFDLKKRMFKKKFAIFLRECKTLFYKYIQLITKSWCYITTLYYIFITFIGFRTLILLDQS